MDQYQFSDDFLLGSADRSPPVRQSLRLAKGLQIVLNAIIRIEGYSPQPNKNFQA